MTVYLLVKFKAAKGRRAELIEGLKENIAFVRAREPGCIQCDLIEAEGDADASICTLLEGYASEEALEAHRAAPYGPQLYARVAPHLDGAAEVVRYRGIA